MGDTGSLWPYLDTRYSSAFGTFETRDLKEAKDGRLWIEGVISSASTDRHGTRWRQDSLKAAIPTYTTRGLHYMHDTGAQIGRVEEIEVVDDSTMIRAWVGRDFDFTFRSGPFGSPVVMSVNNLRKQMEQGLMRGLSIGALVDEEEERMDAPGEKWLQVTDLVEMSVCAIPSNRDTLSTVLRSMAAGGACPLCQNMQRGPRHTSEHDASVAEALAAMRGGNHPTQAELEKQALLAIREETRRWMPSKTH